MLFSGKNAVNYHGFYSQTSGIFGMLKTIIIGSCMSVQGILEKTLPDGRICVRVGSRIFTGLPVSSTA
jgi:hypothetical protein